MVSRLHFHVNIIIIYIFKAGFEGLLRWCFYFFSGRLLSVLRGHLFLPSPPQRPMTSDFEGFSIPNCIHYIYFPILILEKKPVFPFECPVLNKGTAGTICYNVFVMT